MPSQYADREEEDGMGWDGLVPTKAEREAVPVEPQHQPECAWALADCAYKATHYYCPHPEHACTCPVPAEAVVEKMEGEPNQELVNQEKWMTCADCGQRRLMGTLATADDFVCRYCLSLNAKQSGNENQPLSAVPDERAAETADSGTGLLPEFTLADLDLWFRRVLNERLRGHAVREHGDWGAIVNTYAAAEIPDWELRQKHDLVKDAIAGVNQLLTRVSVPAQSEVESALPSACWEWLQRKEQENGISPEKQIEILILCAIDSEKMMVGFGDMTKADWAEVERQRNALPDPPLTPKEKK